MPSARHPFRAPRWRVVSLTALLVVSAGVGLHYAWEDYQRNRPDRANHNRVLLGEDAPASGPVSVPLQAPIELDGMSRSEVTTLRNETVARAPNRELIAEGYEPGDAIFRHIEDGAPWWGMHGLFVFGPGERGIEGASEESRFLLNPLHLVDAEFWGLRRSSRWKRDISSEQLARIPLTCGPKDVTWWPEQRRGQVTFDLSAWAEEVRPWRGDALDVHATEFYLNPINARDLGFSHLYVDIESASNVVQPSHQRDPAQIRDFIHRGSSCGYDGGCNNGSPDQPAFSGLFLRGLPASLPLLLWREPPTSPSTPPDARYELVFR